MARPRPRRRRDPDREGDEAPPGARDSGTQGSRTPPVTHLQWGLDGPLILPAGAIWRSISPGRDDPLRACWTSVCVAIVVADPAPPGAARASAGRPGARMPEHWP